VQPQVFEPACMHGERLSDGRTLRRESFVVDVGGLVYILFASEQERPPLVRWLRAWHCTSKESVQQIVSYIPLALRVCLFLDSPVKISSVATNDHDPG
jgi:hypothetical protein